MCRAYEDESPEYQCNETIYDMDGRIQPKIIVSDREVKGASSTLFPQRGDKRGK